MYIEKDAQVNQKIEMMRLSATASLMSRKDVIIVSSVSCIYGLGNPANYRNIGFEISKDKPMTRDDIIRNLVESLYERNDMELMPGRFRVKGETIDIIPGYYNNIIRVELFGDEIESITEIDKATGDATDEFDYITIYPAKHFVSSEEDTEQAINSIKTELEEQLAKLDQMKAHRLKQRTMFDLEMIEQTGTCKGIENYSAHFDGRKPGEQPYTLLDYFPDDFLMVIDESHQSLPQVRGMYHGDYSRKKSLVDYGFRLPSAFDNRPLQFHEFEKYLKNTIFVSATPGDYEKKHSAQIVEQIIRPTGLVDPIVEVRHTKSQMHDLKQEILATIKKGHRVLVTTLTKSLLKS